MKIPSPACCSQPMPVTIRSWMLSVPAQKIGCRGSSWFGSFARRLGIPAARTYSSSDMFVGRPYLSTKSWPTSGWVPQQRMVFCTAGSIPWTVKSLCQQLEQSAYTQWANPLMKCYRLVQSSLSLEVIIVTYHSLDWVPKDHERPRVLNIGVRLQKIWKESLDLCG